MAVEALYLHIPFCRSKCAYCDFDSRVVSSELLDAALERYLHDLFARLDAFGRAGALSSVRTVYIGGGTPTLLGNRLVHLVERVRAWCAPEEFTCEANPESLTAQLARELAAAGATRVSLGVQSFGDAELLRIGRLHDARDARRAIDAVRDAGLAVSCDLMCGLPGQTSASWRTSLAEAVASGIGHVSVYPLTVEEGTPLARRVAAGELGAPDEDLQATCMEAARRVLRDAGFEPYEVASYARPGAACRHNIAYWTGASYLGIGRSAAGMLTAHEFAQLDRLFPCPETAARAGKADAGAPARIRYVQRDDAGTTFDFEALSAREAIAEDLVLGMRMTRGVSEALLEQASAVIGTQDVERALEQALQQGLACWQPDTAADNAHRTAGTVAAAGGARRLVPTERGWLLGNELYGLFWDLA